MGPFIWRRDLCQNQWHNVPSLDRRYEGFVCLHCNYHMMRFERPSQYNAPIPHHLLVNAPPAEYLQYLPREPFAPIIGPDEVSIASNQTELIGPLYNQPPSWHLDVRYPLPKQASPPSPKVVFKAPPPSVIPGTPKPPPPGLPTVMATSAKHPTKAPPPTLVRPDITRAVTCVLPSIPGVTAKSKPPPPTVPIGPAIPEGQWPPYPIPKQAPQQPKHAQWQCGGTSVLTRE